MKDEYLKLDDEQRDTFHELQESTQEKFLAFRSEEKNDVIDVDIDTKNTYVERFSELSNDEKQYLKTIDTK